MVVIHRAHGYRFVIYTLDHEPAHVHVVGAGLAKINLQGPSGKPALVSPALVSSVGIKPLDMRRLFAQVVERRDEF